MGRRQREPYSWRAVSRRRALHRRRRRENREPRVLLGVFLSDRAGGATALCCQLSGTSQVVTRLTSARINISSFPDMERKKATGSPVPVALSDSRRSCPRTWSPAGDRPNRGRGWHAKSHRQTPARGSGSQRDVVSGRVASDRLQETALRHGRGSQRGKRARHRQEIRTRSSAVVNIKCLPASSDSSLASYTLGAINRGYRSATAILLAYHALRQGCAFSVRGEACGETRRRRTRPSRRRAGYLCGRARHRGPA